MSKIDWVLLAVFLAGFTFFLYGANMYNAIAGYGGIYMCFGTIATYIIMYIYHEVTKKSECETLQTPSQNP